MVSCVIRGVYKLAQILNQWQGTLNEEVLNGICAVITRQEAVLFV